jgi:hypothetical protein
VLVPGGGTAAASQAAASQASGPAIASGDPARAAEAHRALLSDGSIQFDMQPFVPPQPPRWAGWLSELLGNSGPFFTILFWAVVAAIVIAILLALARFFEGRGLSLFKRGKKAAATAEESWTIAEAPARALLADADALAAAGRFSEAAHLLLFRSIEEIDRRRPAVIRPALTSRDIAGAPQLPDGPRSAFQRIVMAVERSLFGGRTLGQADWLGCRDAYEEFAMAREWGR